MTAARSAARLAAARRSSARAPCPRATSSAAWKHASGVRAGPEASAPRHVSALAQVALEPVELRLVEPLARAPREAQRLEHAVHCRARLARSHEALGEGGEEERLQLAGARGLRGGDG